MCGPASRGTTPLSLRPVMKRTAPAHGGRGDPSSRGADYLARVYSITMCVVSLPSGPGMKNVDVK